MAFFRWFVGLPMAAIITAGLFAMMAGLIQQDGYELPPETPYANPKILARTPPPEGPRPRPTRPEKVKPPETVIPPTTRQKTPGPRTVPPRGEPIKVDPGETSRIGGAVIRFPPQYPENCRARAAEGTVTVQFDVSAEGDVLNARVIQTADRCFNRTVVATVSKWKYPPATRNGRAVMRRDVIEVIRFELDG